MTFCFYTPPPYCVEDETHILHCGLEFDTTGANVLLTEHDSHFSDKHAEEENALDNAATINGEG